LKSEGEVRTALYSLHFVEKKYLFSLEEVVKKSILGAG